MGNRGKKPTLIAIAGGSGSGKSWLAGRLASRLPGRVEVICMDSFYRDRAHLSLARRVRVNFDHPRAIEFDRLIEALELARAGRPFEIPKYDYITHSRCGTRDVRPERFLIVEGLWILRTRKVRSLFDRRIFVDASAKWRLDRRLERDVDERARSRASIVRQFRGQVEPMHRRYVQPQAGGADRVVGAPVTEEAVEQLVQDILEIRARDEKSRAQGPAV